MGDAALPWMSGLAWAMRLNLDLAWARRPYLVSRIEDVACLGSRVDNRLARDLLPTKTAGG